MLITAQKHFLNHADVIYDHSLSVMLGAFEYYMFEETPNFWLTSRNSYLVIIGPNNITD